MNCKRARSLFSARIDGELQAEEARSLDYHLRECRDGCPQRWAAFETTVRMVHALPPVEPDPSFVGHVLDRIRAWEAQEAGRTVLGSSRVPMLQPVRRSGIFDRLRDSFEQLTRSRVLAPVRFAGAVALGLAGGLVLGQQGGLYHRATSPSTWGLASGPSVSAPTVPGGASADVPAVSSSRLPFSDLAGDIPSVRQSGGTTDSLRLRPDEAGYDPAVYMDGIGGRQVAATPGQARPRVTITDGRPQITF